MNESNNTMRQGDTFDPNQKLSASCVTWENEIFKDRLKRFKTASAGSNPKSAETKTMKVRRIQHTVSAVNSGQTRDAKSKRSTKDKRISESKIVPESKTRETMFVHSQSQELREQLESSTTRRQFLATLATTVQEKRFAEKGYRLSSNGILVNARTSDCQENPKKTGPQRAAKTAARGTAAADVMEDATDEEDDEDNTDEDTSESGSIIDSCQYDDDCCDPPRENAHHAIHGLPTDNGTRCNMRSTRQANEKNHRNSGNLQKVKKSTNMLFNDANVFEKTNSRLKSCNQQEEIKNDSENNQEITGDCQNKLALSYQLLCGDNNIPSRDTDVSYNNFEFLHTRLLEKLTKKGIGLDDFGDLEICRPSSSEDDDTDDSTETFRCDGEDDQVSCKDPAANGYIDTQESHAVNVGQEQTTNETELRKDVDAKCGIEVERQTASECGGKESERHSESDISSYSSKVVSVMKDKKKEGNGCENQADTENTEKNLNKAVIFPTCEERNYLHNRTGENAVLQCSVHDKDVTPIEQWKEGLDGHGAIKSETKDITEHTASHGVATFSETDNQNGTNMCKEDTCDAQDSGHHSQCHTGSNSISKDTVTALGVFSCEDMAPQVKEPASRKCMLSQSHQGSGGTICDQLQNGSIGVPCESEDLKSSSKSNEGIGTSRPLESHNPSTNIKLNHPYTYTERRTSPKNNGSNVYRGIFLSEKNTVAASDTRQHSTDNAMKSADCQPSQNIIYQASIGQGDIYATDMCAPSGNIHESPVVLADGSTCATNTSSSAGTHKYHDSSGLDKIDEETHEIKSSLLNATDSFVRSDLNTSSMVSQFSHHCITPVGVIHAHIDLTNKTVVPETNTICQIPEKHTGESSNDTASVSNHSQENSEQNGVRTLTETWSKNTSPHQEADDAESWVNLEQCSQQIPTDDEVNWSLEQIIKEDHKVLQRAAETADHKEDKITLNLEHVKVESHNMLQGLEDTTDHKEGKITRNLEHIKVESHNTLQGLEDTVDHKEDKITRNLEHVKVESHNTLQGLEDTTDHKEDKITRNLEHVKVESHNTLQGLEDTIDHKGDKITRNVEHVKVESHNTLQGLEDTTDHKEDKITRNLERVKVESHNTLQGLEDTTDHTEHKITRNLEHVKVESHNTSQSLEDTADHKEGKVTWNSRHLKDENNMVLSYTESRRSLTDTIDNNYISVNSSLGHIKIENHKVLQQSTDSFDNNPDTVISSPEYKTLKTHNVSQGLIDTADNRDDQVTWNSAQVREDNNKVLPCPTDSVDNNHANMTSSPKHIDADRHRVLQGLTDTADHSIMHKEDSCAYSLDNIDMNSSDKMDLLCVLHESKTEYLLSVMETKEATELPKSCDTFARDGEQVKEEVELSPTSLSEKCHFQPQALQNGMVEEGNIEQVTPETLVMTEPIIKSSAVTAVYSKECHTLREGRTFPETDPEVKTSRACLSRHTDVSDRQVQGNTNVGAPIKKSLMAQAEWSGDEATDTDGEEGECRQDSLIRLSPQAIVSEKRVQQRPKVGAIDTKSSMALAQWLSDDAKRTKDTECGCRQALEESVPRALSPDLLMYGDTSLCTHFGCPADPIHNLDMTSYVKAEKKALSPTIPQGVHTVTYHGLTATDVCSNTGPHKEVSAGPTEKENETQNAELTEKGNEFQNQPASEAKLSYTRALYAKYNIQICEREDETIKAETKTSSRKFSSVSEHSDNMPPLDSIYEISRANLRNRNLHNTNLIKRGANASRREMPYQSEAARIEQATDSRVPSVVRIVSATKSNTSKGRQVGQESQQDKSIHQGLDYLLTGTKLKVSEKPKSRGRSASNLDKPPPVTKKIQIKRQTEVKAHDQGRGVSAGRHALKSKIAPSITKKIHSIKSQLEIKSSNQLGNVNSQSTRLSKSATDTDKRQTKCPDISKSSKKSCYNYNDPSRHGHSVDTINLSKNISVAAPKMRSEDGLGMTITEENSSSKNQVPGISSCSPSPWNTRDNFPHMNSPICGDYGSLCRKATTYIETSSFPRKSKYRCHSSSPMKPNFRDRFTPTKKPCSANNTSSSRKPTIQHLCSADKHRSLRSRLAGAEISSLDPATTHNYTFSDSSHCKRNDYSLDSMTDEKGAAIFSSLDQHTVSSLPEYPAAESNLILAGAAESGERTLYQAAAAQGYHENENSPDNSFINMESTKMDTDFPIDSPHNANASMNEAMLEDENTVAKDILYQKFFRIPDTKHRAAQHQTVDYNDDGDGGDDDDDDEGDEEEEEEEEEEDDEDYEDDEDDEEEEEEEDDGDAAAADDDENDNAISKDRSAEVLLTEKSSGQYRAIPWTSDAHSDVTTSTGGTINLLPEHPEICSVKCEHEESLAYATSDQLDDFKTLNLAEEYSGESDPKLRSCLNVTPVQGKRNGSEPIMASSSDYWQHQIETATSENKGHVTPTADDYFGAAQGSRPPTTCFPGSQKKTTECQIGLSSETAGRLCESCQTASNNKNQSVYQKAKRKKYSSSDGGGILRSSADVSQLEYIAGGKESYAEIKAKALAKAHAVLSKIKARDSLLSTQQPVARRPISSNASLKHSNYPSGNKATENNACPRCFSQKQDVRHLKASRKSEIITTSIPVAKDVTDQCGNGSSVNFYQNCDFSRMIADDTNLDNLQNENSNNSTPVAETQTSEGRAASGGIGQENNSIITYNTDTFNPGSPPSNTALPCVTQSVGCTEAVRTDSKFDRRCRIPIRIIPPGKTLHRNWDDRLEKNKSTVSKNINPNERGNAKTGGKIKGDEAKSTMGHFGTSFQANGAQGNNNAEDQSVTEDLTLDKCQRIPLCERIKKYQQNTRARVSVHLGRDKQSRENPRLISDTVNKKSTQKRFPLGSSKGLGNKESCAKTCSTAVAVFIGRQTTPAPSNLLVISGDNSVPPVSRQNEKGSTTKTNQKIRNTASKMNQISKITVSRSSNKQASTRLRMQQKHTTVETPRVLTKRNKNVAGTPDHGMKSKKITSQTETVDPESGAKNLSNNTSTKSSVPSKAAPPKVKSTSRPHSVIDIALTPKFSLNNNSSPIRPRSEAADIKDRQYKRMVRPSCRDSQQQKTGSELLAQCGFFSRSSSEHSEYKPQDQEAEKEKSFEPLRLCTIKEKKERNGQALQQRIVHTEKSVKSALECNSLERAVPGLHAKHISLEDGDKNGDCLKNKVDDSVQPISCTQEQESPEQRFLSIIHRKAHLRSTNQTSTEDLNKLIKMVPEREEIKECTEFSQPMVEASSVEDTHHTNSHLNDRQSGIQKYHNRRSSSPGTLKRCSPEKEIAAMKAISEHGAHIPRSQHLLNDDINRTDQKGKRVLNPTIATSSPRPSSKPLKAKGFLFEKMTLTSEDSSARSHVPLAEVENIDESNILIEHADEEECRSGSTEWHSLRSQQSPLRRSEVSPMPECKLSDSQISPTGSSSLTATTFSEPTQNNLPGFSDSKTEIGVPCEDSTVAAHCLEDCVDSVVTNSKMRTIHSHDSAGTLIGNIQLTDGDISEKELHALEKTQRTKLNAEKLTLEDEFNDGGKKALRASNTPDVAYRECQDMDSGRLQALEVRVASSGKKLYAHPPDEAYQVRPSKVAYSSLQDVDMDKPCPQTLKKCTEKSRCERADFENKVRLQEGQLNTENNKALVCVTSGQTSREIPSVSTYLEKPRKGTLTITHSDFKPLSTEDRKHLFDDSSTESPSYSNSTEDVCIATSNHCTLESVTVDKNSPGNIAEESHLPISQNPQTNDQISPLSLRKSANHHAYSQLSTSPFRISSNPHNNDQSSPSSFKIFPNSHVNFQHSASSLRISPIPHSDHCPSPSPLRISSNLNISYQPSPSSLRTSSNPQTNDQPSPSSLRISPNLQANDQSSPSLVRIPINPPVNDHPSPSALKISPNPYPDDLLTQTQLGISSHPEASNQHVSGRKSQPATSRTQSNSQPKESSLPPLSSRQAGLPHRPKFKRHY